MIESIAAVVTALGVVFAGIALRSAQLQRNRQFESLYVQRYWVLMDKLSLKALHGAKYEELGDDDKQTLELYLRLCEDQLEMRRLGAITHDTNDVWVSGMEAALKREPFKGAMCHATERQPGSLTLLTGLDKTPDPIEGNGFRQWLAGVHRRFPAIKTEGEK